MNLYGIRLKEDDIFGKVHHAALTLAALLSGALFTTDLPWWGWLSSILNLIALILVPTHMKKDDNQLTSGGQSSELPTRVVWKKAGNVIYFMKIDIWRGKKEDIVEFIALET